MGKIDDIVKKVMQEPVPMNGQLIHPMRSGSKHKIKQVTIADAKSLNLPTDVKFWTPKSFVDYFAKKYQESFDANYRKVYRSDMMLVQNMGDFLVSNGLDRNSWTKKLIDWGFRRRDEILRKEHHFTLQEVLRQINYFYQQEVLPKVEENEIERDTQDTVLLEEIQKADEDGKITEVFVRFGIPVAVTYIVNFRNIPIENIIDATEQRIKLLYNGSTVEKTQLEKILQSSVIGSPYPSGFMALDWRQMFSSFVNKYKTEPWWRDEDYRGKPLQKYYSLI
jgi:hypothetical protein